MTQAPDTTVATAVRQHGGGRHQLNLQCTVQAGRLQDSRGGVINRRAEGATSSNTLPASCAAAAHPTTGVRRARELSSSLRSQNRPHAQLVEGYTPYTSHVRMSSGKPVDNLSASYTAVFKTTYCGTPTLKIEAGESEIRNQLFPKSGHNFHLPKQVNLQIVQLHNWYGIQRGRMGRPFKIRAFFKVFAERRCRAEIQRPLQGSKQNPQLYALIMSEQQKNLPQLFFSLTLLDGLMGVGENRSPRKSKHRSNRLNPRGPNLTGIYSQHNYVGGRKNQDHARHRDHQVLLCPLPAAFVPHPYHLDAQEHRPSLPAPCHHVQRGAA